jgi:uncharacterized repeat protein (TIGR03803 family)
MGKFGLSTIVCIVVVFCVMAIGAPAQTSPTLTTLHSFNSTDGVLPVAGLVQGTDGNLYGTTSGGGAHDDGTVFKITTAGMLGTPLHSFGGTDGQNPEGGLVQSTDGNFYGTTVFGGVNPLGQRTNYGTVFKITPAGMLTFPPLHSFNQTDGEAPEAGLMLSNRILYSTTYSGGSDPLGGTVFKITGTTLATLHNFTTDPGGYHPAAGLVQGTDGNFYGTTYHGGANNDGTVFKMTPAGMVTSPPLHSFNSADGAHPAAVLIQGTDGNFYGTTVGGGTRAVGTVFKITPAGVLTTPPWHSFGGANSGSEPMAGLVQATDGNFYGTTYAGSTVGHNHGTIFKITPAGVLTTLFALPRDDKDGYYPRAGLVQATDGNLYGTTSAGGASKACDGGCGTVFKLSVGLGPFVETEPTSGRVGTGVLILGNNLTGASSVTFNGTAATFTVVSASEIRTTVPSGATTGKVKVTIPSRTLISNVNFRVS